MGSLLAVLLPDELRHDDRARAALMVIGEALESMIRIGAPAST